MAPSERVVQGARRRDSSKINIRVNANPLLPFVSFSYLDMDMNRLKQLPVFGVMPLEVGKKWCGRVYDKI